MKTLLFAATALATATAFAAPAEAAFFDYSGTRLLQQGGGANFSTIEVNLFIRTDGTQGVLHASNIVLFQIGLTRRDSANLITHSRFLKSNGSSPAELSIEGQLI